MKSPDTVEGSARWDISGCAFGFILFQPSLSFFGARYTPTWKPNHKFPNISGRTSTWFFISSECFEAPRRDGPNLSASTNEQRKRLIASDWQAMRLPQWLLFGFLWKSNSSSELNDSKRAYYHKGVHVSGAIDYLWIDRTVWVKHSTSVLKIKYRASFFTYSAVIYFVLCFSLHLEQVVFHAVNNTIMELIYLFLLPFSHE